MKLSAEAGQKLNFTDGKCDVRIAILQGRDTTLYQHNIVYVIESDGDH